LLIVRVYNDNVGFGMKPRLLGLWFMTIKYLLLFPDYCKHSAIELHGEGAISGTFLLTDAKLRGSAMRVLGPHDLGAGFSGELDMDLHLTHSPLVPSLPPVKPTPAIEQLTYNSTEDDCKFGNWAELREFLSSGPIRYDIEVFTIRKAVIEMSDVFSNIKSGQNAASNDEKKMQIDVVDFAPFKTVTMLGLLEGLKEQLVGRIVFNNQALSSAVGEMAQGMGEKMSHEFEKLKGAMSAASDGMSKAAAATAAVTASAASSMGMKSTKPKATALQS